jgi:hypothetical protein
MDDAGHVGIRLQTTSTAGIHEQGFPPQSYAVSSMGVATAQGFYNPSAVLLAAGI